MLTITLARWFIALVLYVSIIGILVYLRPAMLFDAEGRVKQWGVCTDGGYSIFSPQILFPMIAVVVYVVVILVELVVL